VTGVQTCALPISEGYFLNRFDLEAARSKNNPEAVKECYDKESEAKQQFIDQANKLLAGSQNAGRALYTENIFNQISKEYDGIKIEPIKFDMKDSALLELFEKTNQANISSQGIHPTLANVETAGKLSSGSEMRNAFNFYVNTKTPRPRRLILKMMDAICRFNGWDVKYPDLKFTFEDFTLTKLDDNKSGVQSEIKGQENE
jgi:hypothetical protein